MSFQAQAHQVATKNGFRTDRAKSTYPVIPALFPGRAVRRALTYRMGALPASWRHFITMAGMKGVAA